MQPFDNVRKTLATDAEHFKISSFLTSQRIDTPPLPDFGAFTLQSRGSRAATQEQGIMSAQPDRPFYPNHQQFGTPFSGHHMDTFRLSQTRPFAPPPFQGVAHPGGNPTSSNHLSEHRPWNPFQTGSIEGNSQDQEVCSGCRQPVTRHSFFCPLITTVRKP